MDSVGYIGLCVSQVGSGWPVNGAAGRPGPGPRGPRGRVAIEAMDGNARDSAGQPTISSDRDIGRPKQGFLGNYITIERCWGDETPGGGPDGRLPSHVSISPPHRKCKNRLLWGIERNIFDIFHYNNYGLDVSDYWFTGVPYDPI